MGRHHRVIVTCAVLASAFLLAGCETSDMMDKIQDMIPFGDNKKPLQGERKQVFPEGVPGVPQGVPPDMMKGSQTQMAAPPPAEQAAAPPPEQPKPKKAAVKKKPAAQPAAAANQPPPPTQSATVQPAPQSARPDPPASAARPGRLRGHALRPCPGGSRPRGSS